jgi:polyisoprenoid-binding protein YceI
MTGRTKLIAGALAAVVLGAGAVFGAATLLNRAPAETTLSSAVASVAPLSDLVGTWTVVADGRSFAGYRVKEELANVGATTAVGRTTNLTGEMTFDGAAITGVEVVADLTTLTSDNSFRDNQLRRQALETNQYPTATFRLTQPIALPAIPDEGVPLRATAQGDLTLHGVTRPVTVALEGQRVGDLVVVVGSLEVRFADFNIAQPASMAVLSIEDRGTMELQLVFAQSNRGS